jgi:hypothetical protein
MNHAKNTPGYDHRCQLLFTLRDGEPRAWMLVELGGRGQLVSMSYETARAWIEKDLADQLPAATVVDQQLYGRPVLLTELGVKPAHANGAACCSSCAAGKPCEKTGALAVGVIDVEVIGAQKTETVVAVAGRGRLVSGAAAVGEPLMGVAEGTEDRVACCGGVCEDHAGTPQAIVFDRYKPNPAGGYAVAESTTHELPPELAGAYAERAPQCLPWVRVTRSPENFRECLALARTIGPIENKKAVKKLVGKYMIKQDQEVFLVILLDVQCQLRGISEVARGSRDRVDVPVPDVLRIAIVDGASAIILVHNHPSGVNKPSQSDVMLTKTFKKACEEINLRLMDHVILAGDKSYSFVEDHKPKILKI